jgi:ABC-type Fe3+ transport system permease subunit
MSAVLHAASDVLALVPGPGIPNPGGGTPPPGAEKITTVIQWVAWLFFAGCVVGIFYAGGQMIYEHSRGLGGGEGTSRLVKVLVCTILGASASGIVGVLAVSGH